MRRFVAVSIVLLAAALGSPARADILIGLAGPITGKIAWFGEQMERGAAQAVADLNAKGGVLGNRCSSSPRTTSAIPSRRSPPQGSWSATA
jgi:branched-chain amino acid transport system substrate-binding protein